LLKPMGLGNIAIIEIIERLKTVFSLAVIS
jgi:hypothetical protein